MERRIRSCTPREYAARRATAVLLALIWIVAGPAGTRGPSGGGAAERANALAPLTVDPWRDPRWRLQLIPGIGKRRSGRLVAARRAAGGLPWQSLEDLAWLDDVDARTLRALRAVCAGPAGCAGCAGEARRGRKPGHTQPVLITLGAGGLTRP